MKLKNLSKILAFGILLNNIPISSFASVLSEDTRYETFIDNDIAVKDVLEENRVDIKINGNTLVNLANGDYNKAGNSNSTSQHIDNGYSAKVIDSNGGSLVIHKGAVLKDDTKYTLVCEINTNMKGLSYSFKNNSNYAQGIINEQIDYSNGYTKVTKVLTTTSNCTDIVIGNHSNANSIDTYLNIKNIMLLESDWTNRGIPEYFEGLQSSFEDQLITQEMIDNQEESTENLGKYKVEYKVTGKNKLLINEENGDFTNRVVSYSNNEIIMQSNDSGGWKYDCIDIIPVKKNTQYTLSYNCEKLVNGEESNIKIFGTDYRGNAGSNILVYGDKGKTFTQKTFNTYNHEFIYVLAYTVADAEGYNLEQKIRFYNIQIEESDKATSYEPYKELINTFYLNSPLLEGDTIEYINGQVTHIRRSGLSRLDGGDNEEYRNWITTGNTPPENTSVFILVDSKEKHLKNISLYGYNTEKMLSNNFLQEEISKGPFKMQFYINLHLSVPTNELISPDEAGFKEWLQNNPTTVIYKLANPIYEPIKANLSVNLFEGTTHISNNSNIPATIEVTVDRTINRAVEYTELAKTNPTINNLSKARYWNNLLKDSIKKDQLQEEVNSITTLNDMELERKTATSNLDLYIKSENILMMNLNTNTITFEDFSGVEDMTKENAVQISINSSLPYSLNAYLPIEIQNSDKSVTMDKDILNIKENSEFTYQTFANTTDKIILKDNNQAGNDLIHNIDIKLKGGITHQKDVYKATIKLEAEQK